MVSKKVSLLDEAKRDWINYEKRHAYRKLPPKELAFKRELSRVRMATFRLQPKTYTTEQLEQRRINKLKYDKTYRDNLAKAKQQNQEERERRNLSVKKSREKKKLLLQLVASSLPKSDNCDIGYSDHMDCDGDQDVNYDYDYNDYIDCDGDQEANYDNMANTPVDDEANFAFDIDTHASDPEDIEANFALAGNTHASFLSHTCTDTTDVEDISGDEEGNDDDGIRQALHKSIEGSDKTIMKWLPAKLDKYLSKSFGLYRNHGLGLDTRHKAEVRKGIISII